MWWKKNKDLVKSVLIVSTGLAAMTASIMAMVTAARGDFFMFPVGLVFALIAALLLASPMSGLAANPFGTMLFPEARFDRPQPLYSRAEALIRKRKYIEAMTLYEEISESFPALGKPYIDMIDLAVMELHDPGRARRIYERGMSSLKDIDERATLARMYRAIRSRDNEIPDWGQKHQIDVDLDDLRERKKVHRRTQKLR
jgi:hypothetical protein